ncbi:uncharacterized protein LOC123530753 isoform X3 [Mercenaria mercenaria]|uniref:uncharacterized protein LOC123530753 isoform X3 n=1 Tax=Mercenaria mercenaria TaxID=6596 RepID=UPI00234EA56E|nr:uncharacterized protein LOC123530753 isoform X3 [Mercenaria mercenaria]
MRLPGLRMVFRRPTTDDKVLPETVKDGDKSVSFFEQLKANARKNVKTGRKGFITTETPAIFCLSELNYEAKHLGFSSMISVDR